MLASRPAAGRQIYLVQPKFPPSYWGMDHFLPMTPYRAIFPPLGLLTLAALTPPEFGVTLCDENVGERIDYDTDARIIGITGYIIQMAHVFKIADRFRARGKTVVLGGPLANLLPDECRKHCDVLFEGEAEYTWPRFLREFAAGIASDHYHEFEKIHLPDSPPPRLEVAKGRYAHGVVQCSRGCPFTCEFCDIIVMYGRKMRFKPVEQVLQEVRAWHARGVTQLFFADDNFVGHRAYAKELLRTLAKWNTAQREALSYYTQASIDMARDEEMLGLLRDANFVLVFIGIESPRKASLAETHKTQNERIDLVAAVHKIQSYNLFISAGMIVGFDQDDMTIFDEQYEFLQAANIPVVMLSVLLAIPKTPLYLRLEAAGRINNGTDFSGYVGTSGGTNFRPLNLTAEELRHGQERLYRRLYAPEAFAARLLGNLERFHDVTYRSEPTRLKKVATLLRVIRHYWRQGKAARRFFWGIVGKTVRHSPRSLKYVIQLLGLYKHFCEVNAQSFSWDPWATPSEVPESVVPRRVDSASRDKARWSGMPSGSPSIAQTSFPDSKQFARGHAQR
jgi:radical SAM superfamily enzyme YgiQ (UPF0313 family)